MKSGFVGAVVVAVGIMVATVPPPTHAKSFAVNITGDAPDATPGNGLCATVPGNCTLRAAIQEANSLAGADEVTVPAGRFTVDAGALEVTDDLTITGAGTKRTKIDARRKSLVFHIVGPARVTISQATIQNGLVTGANGGALVNDGGTLTLSHVIFLNNRGSAGGGAVFNQGEGSLTLTDVAFTRNRAGGGGGLSSWGGPVTLTNVTFSGNEARNGAGGIEHSSGSALTLLNVTFYRNKAPYGAALFNSGPGTVALTNVTVAQNTVNGRRYGKGYTAGSLANYYGTVILTNSIVAGKSTCETAGRIESGGHNIDSGDTCGFNAPGDLSNTDPQLGKLSDNGGSTETVPLRLGSPAIDAGDATVCPATDQRGASRPQGADCDVGAYEVLRP